MQQRNLNAKLSKDDPEFKSKLKEAERWLKWWATQVEKGYVRIGHKSHSPEQAVAGGGIGFTPEPTQIEERCMALMMELKKTEPDLYTVATIEYRKQGEFFHRCNINKGWVDLTTNVFHPVATKEHYDEQTKRRVVVGDAKKKDFMKYIKAHWGVEQKRYYRLLERCKIRVVHWVL